MRLQPVEIAARCELLGSLHETAKAPQEASVLLSGLEAGRWPISKGTFASDYPKVKELAGQPAETHALDTRLAGAETVESGWDDWQLVQRSDSRSVTKSWHKSGPIALLGFTGKGSIRVHPDGKRIAWTANAVEQETWAIDNLASALSKDGR